VKFAQFVTHCSLSNARTCVVLLLTIIGAFVQIIGLILAAQIVLTVRHLHRDIIVTPGSAHVAVSAHNPSISITESAAVKKPRWWKRLQVSLKTDPRSWWTFALLGLRNRVPRDGWCCRRDGSDLVFYGTAQQLGSASVLDFPVGL
jgi:hypothetical protein